VIRGKLHQCPFGLPVAEGCISIGAVRKDGEKNRAIARDMTPLDLAEHEEERKELAEKNMDLMFLAEEKIKCPFADRVFEDKGSVDCKYDEDQSRLPAGNVGLTGSPLYPRMMIGNMPEAQYGYPLDQYSDNNESRSVYYGIYSLVG
jgi:hypothetical protein